MPGRSRWATRTLSAPTAPVRPRWPIRWVCTRAVVNGAASGLFHDGLSIFLYNIGGVITGSTATSAGLVTVGNTAFTLSVERDRRGDADAVGKHRSQPDQHLHRRLHQRRAVAGSGLVDLTAVATTTDREGDNAVSTPAVFDVGSHVSFGDDGPKSPTLTVGAVGSTLITFDGGLAGGNFVGTQDAADSNGSPVIAKESFPARSRWATRTLSAPTAPVRPRWPIRWVCTRAVVNGAASGLFHDGLSIFLYNIGGVITGSTATSAGLVDCGQHGVHAQRRARPAR